MSARCLALLLLLAAFSARADTPVRLFKSWAGNVNFTGTVATLRNSSSDPCSVYPASSTLSVALAGIPSGATILSAQLYWAGSGSTPDYTVGFESGNVTSLPARSYTSQSSGADFFSGAVDVTAQVQARGNGNYQFFGLAVDSGAPYCAADAVVSGFTLLVVYAASSEPYRVLNLYEGFQYYRSTSLATTMGNVRIPSPLSAAMTGRVGHITWAGDVTAGQSGENLAFNGASMSDALNPAGNQFNSKSNINGNAASYGVDFDAYDVAAPIIAAGQTSATTLYASGADMVLLSAQLVAVPSVPAVDLSVTMTRASPFSTGTAGSYTLSAHNSGTATDNGPVTLVDTLPAGLTYLSFSAASGWDCTASGQLVTCKIAGPFAPNTSLPDLTITVLPTAEGSITNSATVSGAGYDYIASNNGASDTTTVTTGAASYAFTDSACQPNVAFGVAGQCGLLTAQTRWPAALAQDVYLTALQAGVPAPRSTSATTVPLYFAMTCVLPRQNANVRPAINGVALPLCADGPTAPASQTGAFSSAIALAFGANAASSKITLFYADVGRVLISVTEGAGPISTGPGVVFRPLALQMTIDNQAPATVSSTSAPFRAAGLPFPVKVTALMANNLPAPNFGNGDASIALDVATPSVSGTSDEKAMAAAMGSLPGLVTTGMDKGVGGAFNGSATFNEVGVVLITASVNGGYLGGSDVVVAVQKAGRFYPFAFHTKVTPVFAKCTDVFAACPKTTPGAAYATQGFDVAVKPVDANNLEVQNFRGVFGYPITLQAFDSAGGSSENPPGAPAKLTAAAIPALQATDTNALLHTSASYALAVSFNRSAPANGNWTGPTAIFLRASAFEVTSKQAATSVEAGITILNGRLLLSTVSGSELLRLPVTMKAQFWLPSSPAGAWTTNPADNSATPTTIAFSACQRNLLVAGACYSGLTMATRDTAFSAGSAKFFIPAPGPGKSGSAMLNMTGAPAWLPSSLAQAVFGVYRSNFLYLREVY